MSKAGKRVVKSKAKSTTSTIQDSTKSTLVDVASSLDLGDRALEPKYPAKGKPLALWCDVSVELLLRLRFRDMNDRFSNAKSAQMKKDAYGILAAELSSALQREYDHNKVQNKRYDWTFVFEVRQDLHPIGCIFWQKY
ncbi:hypothetical protein AC1031_018107 [Aphanomyces cochlioides]|nr:hypothetical protein AC1031_018107 [Aphanomyces cochlioides]